MIIADVFSKLITLPGVYEGSVTDSLCFTNENDAPARARTEGRRTKDEGLQINTPLRSYSQVRMMIYIYIYIYIYMYNTHTDTPPVARNTVRHGASPIGKWHGMTQNGCQMARDDMA